MTNANYPWPYATQGLAADIPSTLTAPLHSLYYETDTGNLDWFDGSAWQTISGGGGGSVSSVFGRTGAVVAVDGDYYGIVAAALTGATEDSRYAGAVLADAPSSGTFVVGDFLVGQTGSVFVCIVAGSPGTWVRIQSPTIVSVAFTQGDGAGDLSYQPSTRFSYPMRSANDPGLGGGTILLTGLPVLISAGNQVAEPTINNVIDIPIDADIFDLLLTLTVTNMLGTEVIQVSNGLLTTPGDTTLTGDWSGATDSVLAGTDLSWDGTKVNSTVGGVYVAAMRIETTWD